MAMTVILNRGLVGICTAMVIILGMIITSIYCDILFIKCKQCTKRYFFFKRHRKKSGASCWAVSADLTPEQTGRSSEQAGAAGP